VSTEGIIKEVNHAEGRRRYLRGNKVFGDGKASQKIVQILINHSGSFNER